MISFRRNKLQRGISLLEVLLSLSIIAIILVMATRYFFLASDNDRINVTRQEIGSVIAAVQAWKGQNTQYSSSLSISQLYTDGFLTKSNSLDTGASTAKLYDPWGDIISLTGKTTYVEISIPLQKKKYCTALKNSYPYATCGTNGTTFALDFPDQSTT